MRIVVYEAGEAPEVELVGDVDVVRLTRREKNTLYLLGIWSRSGTVESRANWLKHAADGSIWAGGYGKVAKVRGKDGRHLAGRMPMPDHEKRKTTSIQLAASEREKLERMAAQASEAEGKRVTISGVVERLVRRA